MHRGCSPFQTQVRSVGPGGHAELEGKMIRPVHMDALFVSVECYGVASLDLSRNQLGMDFFKVEKGVQRNSMHVAFERTWRLLNLNATITNLNLGWNSLGPKGAALLALGIKGNTTLTSLLLDGNCICGIYKDFNHRTQSIEEMGTYTAEGFTRLCQALQRSAVTSLRCAAAAARHSPIE